MLSQLKLELDRILAFLDTSSDRFRKVVFDPGLFFSNPNPEPRKSSQWLSGLTEAMGVLVVLLIAVTISRDAQFQTMFENLDAYFLGGLVNVSTTHDSGYYMLLAKEWIERITAGAGISDVNPGFLLPYVLANYAISLGVTLEEAGVDLVYISGVATSFAAYLLFVVLRQNILGLFVAISMVFIWPIYSRISIGMIDTELLNLFLFLVTLASLTAAVSQGSAKREWTFCLFAGLTNYVLYLCYARSGFTLAFMFAYLGLSFAERKGVKTVLVGTIFFMVASGYHQVTTMWSTLWSFLNLYLFRQDTETALSNSAGFNSANFQSLFYPTISEAQLFSTANLLNDFGVPLIFWLGCLVVITFILSDWKRLFPLSPMLAFLALYFAAGQRFAYYAAPLLAAGMFVTFGTIIKIAGRGLLDRREPIKSQAISFHQPAAIVLKKEGRQYNHWHVLGAIAAFLLIWWLGVFHRLGIAPPPVIKASELQILREAVGYPKHGAKVVTWWDYGYEVRYQVNAAVITTGANPADVRNIYLARALTTMDPYYASDEIRFASYFYEDDLNQAFPARPEISKARGIDQDLLLFIPSDLQLKMFTIYKIAEKTTHPKMLENYDPQKSAFFTLYHHSPKKWGPFELVAKQNGAVVYKLPSPKVSK